MFYFKGCQKCKGDLHLERDSYGAYLKCLQCGRTTDVQAQEAGLDDGSFSGLKKAAA